VTVFVALDRVIRQGWTPEEAMVHVDLPSLPPVWQEWISGALADHL
jgi:hypothetical protein